jgi:CobQ-like glutamine amidotransferase family enzyme
MTVQAPERLAIVLLLPDLLGTYGDSGNADILAKRLLWRGIAAEILTVRSGDPVPVGAQLYVVGGGEDLPQALASRQLGSGAGHPLRRAVDAGAVVLAVCAGLQILGSSFVGPDGEESEGLGILDCRTVRGRGPRSVGEVVTEAAADLNLGELTGYENHAGVTELGPDATPLGRVLVGVGNGDGSGCDGARTGRVLGTYMHGPVLARNPGLADLLLGWVVGELSPLDDAEAQALRGERLHAARAGRAAMPRRLDRVARLLRR